jgi:hypothetical protein
MASWWHQFHIQFARVIDVILHVFRYPIVEDMFLGDNAGPFQLEQECVVCSYYLGILAVLHGLDKDGVTIGFHQLVASKRLGGELASLVGEFGFVYHVCLGVHIVHFLAVEVGGDACFQWRRLCFGGPYVFFLFGSDAPLRFQLSWGSTFGCCVQSALASPQSFPL